MLRRAMLLGNKGVNKWGGYPVTRRGNMTAGQTVDYTLTYIGFYESTGSCSISEITGLYDVFSDYGNNSGFTLALTKDSASAGVAARVSITVGGKPFQSDIYYFNHEVASFTQIECPRYVTHCRSYKQNNNYYYEYSTCREIEWPNVINSDDISFKNSTSGGIVSYSNNYIANGTYPQSSVPDNGLKPPPSGVFGFVSGQSYQVTLEYLIEATFGGGVNPLIIKQLARIIAASLRRKRHDEEGSVACRSLSGQRNVVGHKSWSHRKERKRPTGRIPVGPVRRNHCEFGNRARAKVSSLYLARGAWRAGVLCCARRPLHESGYGGLCETYLNGREFYSVPIRSRRGQSDSSLLRTVAANAAFAKEAA